MKEFENVKFNESEEMICPICGGIVEDEEITDGGNYCDGFFVEYYGTCQRCDTSFSYTQKYKAVEITCCYEVD